MKLPHFLEEDEFGSISVKGTRVGLDHLVYYYNEGNTLEYLAVLFPTVCLADIENVVGFYEEHKQEVDAYVKEEEAECEKLRAAAPKGPTLAELTARLEAKRRAKAS